MLLTLTPNKKHLLHVDWPHVLACSGVIETRAQEAQLTHAVCSALGYFLVYFIFKKALVLWISRLISGP